MGNYLQQKICLPHQHITFAHHIPAANQRFKFLKICFRLAGQANKGKNGDSIAQRFRVDIGMIALNNVGIFQRSYTPQAGRGRNTGILCQFHIGHPAIFLQVMQNLLINRIKFELFRHNLLYCQKLIFA